MYKLWYAVQANEDDNAWDCGSFNLREAEKMAIKLGDSARIAVISDAEDPRYTVCVREMGMEEIVNDLWRRL